jgi:hypothetical protein
VRRSVPAAIGAVFALAASVWVCVAAQTAPVQNPAPPAARPTGLIIGRVIDGSTNAPIAGATVTLTGTGLRSLRVIVDPQGRFVFTSVPAGSFTITAARAGYLNGSYGTLRPDGAGRPLDRATGRVGDVVRAWRYATIMHGDGRRRGRCHARPCRCEARDCGGRWRCELNSEETPTSVGHRITGLVPGGCPWSRRSYRSAAVVIGVGGCASARAGDREPALVSIFKPTASADT